MVRKAKKAASKATAKDYSIIHAPLITEKASHVGNGGNTIVFTVQKNATKDEIKLAIERIFDKNVVAVRTANILGKIKKKGRTFGRTASIKKAYVTLKEGQTIEVIEGV